MCPLRNACLRLAGALFLVAAVGCGDGSKIVSVSGTLTFNGKPVTNAYVDFVPQQGRPSWGQTDADGRFKLNYDRGHDGVLTGKHKVSVRMRPTTTVEQEAVMKGDRPPLSKEMAEFFDKYSAQNSKKEIVIEKSTRELQLDWQ